MTETENVVIMKKPWRFFLPGPPLVLLLFAQALTGTVLTDLIVYRTCLITLNVSYAKCFMLRTNASNAESQKLEAEIDPHASMIIMAKSLVESILPALLSLFFGPWSDRGGRKPLLVAGFTGFTLMHATLSLMCNWNISPWYLLIPSIPASMLGGFGVIIFASICYVSDTTAKEDRTMLLALVQASVLSGLLLGTFTGPLIYKHYGYTLVFSTAAICCTLALLYTYFCIPETVRDTSKESIWGLFKTSFVKELVTSSLTKRDGFHRSIVWLIISILTTFILILEGEASIAYLFTRERLGWDVQHFSYISGIAMAINMIGVLCGVSLLSRVLGFPDTLIAAIGLTSGLACAITKSLVTQDWHMYLAACVGLVSGMMAPVLRSILSKSVPPQDIGKIFAITSSVETLSPLAGAPLYTLIYSRYLPPIYPSPVYLVSATFFVLSILAVVWIEVLLRKSHTSRYDSLIADD